MRADLHIHSSYSFDAKDSIETIISKAIKNNIEYISICDHNEVDGNLEASKDGRIRVIPGIEIDCFFKEKVIHVLGYGCDLLDPRFSKLALHYRSELDRIASERLKLIEEHHNVKLDIDKIKSYSHSGVISNVEIERVLLEDCDNEELKIYQTGSKSDNPIAAYYWDNLAIGKWGYVELRLPDYKDIIKFINDTKGVAICAHPKVTIGRNRDDIQELIEANIEGFEVYCSYHDQEDIAFYDNICKQYNLLKTCGSDYHGITKPNIEIGDTNHKEDDKLLVEALLRRIDNGK